MNNPEPIEPKEIVARAVPDVGALFANFTSGAEVELKSICSRLARLVRSGSRQEVDASIVLVGADTLAARFAELIAACCENQSPQQLPTILFGDIGNHEWVARNATLLRNACIFCVDLDFTSRKQAVEVKKRALLLMNNSTIHGMAVAIDRVGLSAGLLEVEVFVCLELIPQRR